tara:strand:+ start:284 stop:940 length:657 start_codon:yes stop_codon:yes gene_type:complete
MDDLLISYSIVAFSSLFTLVNPIGFTAIFLSMVDGMNRSEKQKIAIKGVMTACIVLVIFSLIGRLIFSFFGITIDAFKIVGGILFFRSGLNLLESKISRTRSTPMEIKEAVDKEEIAFTPIGIPMIAGPGAITSVMILSAEATTFPYRIILLSVIFITMVLTLLFSYLGEKFTTYIGTTGMRIIQRIMGLILMVIAVQFIIDGLTPIVINWISMANHL